LTAVQTQQSEESLKGLIKSVTDLIKLYESGKIRSIKKQDAPLSIKLIPNSERVQIEQSLVLKELNLAKLEQLLDGNPSTDQSIEFPDGAKSA
jgi:hypothetical protein